jgi:hypothetical protein
MKGTAAMTTPTSKTILALEWAEALQSGEMIETHDYTREYLSFRSNSPISMFELDSVCQAVNTILKAERSAIRVKRVGTYQIRPVIDPDRIVIIDRHL